MHGVVLVVSLLFVFLACNFLLIAILFPWYLTFEYSKVTMDNSNTDTARLTNELHSAGHLYVKFFHKLIYPLCGTVQYCCLMYSTIQMPTKHS